MAAGSQEHNKGNEFQSYSGKRVVVCRKRFGIRFSMGGVVCIHEIYPHEKKISGMIKVLLDNGKSIWFFVNRDRTFTPLNRSNENNRNKTLEIVS